MNIFYLVYAILLLFCNALFVWQTIKYTVYAIHGNSRLYKETDPDKQVIIISKINQAKIRAFSWAAIFACTMYANIDCVLNIWR